jgi:hypothetical protein
MTAWEWLNSPAPPGGKMNLKEKIAQVRASTIPSQEDQI